MTDPVTVFMLVVAGVLVVGTVGEQVFARTGVPSVIWLVMLGVLVRVADLVPAPVIHMLAPFFAALALVIILFDAGTNLTGGAGEAALGPATRKRAQLLAFIGFAASVVLVALFSWGLAGLGILKVWSWAHALMLGSLMACGASEVVLPSLAGLPAMGEARALLRRESAITKALAVTGTVVCLDLLSPRVSEGGAALAMTAGFGFALAFGSVAGMLWVVALQRLANLTDVRWMGVDEGARDYGFTLAVMVVVHVLSEAAGGSGPLSVLVFGAVLGNAEGILHMFGRGAAETSSAVQTALGGHARTISFVRTLVFVMVGLTLAPPWGPIVMGVALALLLLIVRLAVARFALAGLEHRERSVVGACAPRGLATVALVTLPLAHAVPGAAEMVTLVFSAVVTSVLLFTLGLHGLGRATPRGTTAPATRGRTGAAERETPEVAAVRPARGERPVSTVQASAQSMVDELSGAQTRPPASPRERSGPQRSAGPHTPRWPREHSGSHTNLLREASGAAAVVRARRGAQAVVGATVVGAGGGAQAVVGAGGEAQAVVVREGGEVRAGDVEVPAQGPHASEGYMQTLLQVDVAAEDPLASAMARALARRPDDVAPRRRFSTSDIQVPEELGGFHGGDAEALVAGLESSDGDERGGPPRSG